MATKQQIDDFHALNTAGIFTVDDINYLNAKGLIPTKGAAIFFGSNNAGLSTSAPGTDAYPRRGYLIPISNVASIQQAVTNPSLSGNVILGVIKTDGTLHTWGNPSSGANFRTSSTPDVPTQAGTDTDWLKYRGSQHAIGIKTTGRMYSAGSQSNGQAGRNTTSIVAYGEVTTPSGVIWKDFDIASGHSIAVDSLGRLFSCGNNANGRTGLNTATGNTLVFTQVGTATDWLNSYLSAGPVHTLIRKADGTIWGFGNNVWGQAAGAQAGTSTVLVPVQIGTANNWVRVWAHTGFSYALNTLGEFYGWGGSNTSSLGNGTQATSYTPLRLFPDRTFVDFIPQMSTGTLSNAGGGLLVDANNDVYSFGDTKTNWEGESHGDLRYAFTLPNGSMYGTGGMANLIVLRS